MATALDVAAYILQKSGPMSAMKLQKLVYYSQAWSLVWDDAPLFAEQVEAWANGPVVPALYIAHRGMFKVAAGDIPGKPESLNPDQRQTVDVVLKYYGDKSPQWLSDLTHSEDPWKNARKGLDPGERGDEVIRKSDMAEYYGSL